jgi:hypothetical protein
VIYLFCVDI